MGGIVMGAFIYLLSCVWEIVKYLCMTSQNLGNNEQQTANENERWILTTNVRETVWGKGDKSWNGFVRCNNVLLQAHYWSN